MKSAIDLYLSGKPSSAEPVSIFVVEKSDLPSSLRIAPEKFFSPATGVVWGLLLSKLSEPAEVQEFAEELLAVLSSRGIKRATIVGIGAGGAVAQAMVLADRKLCRRLALVDASCRLRPSSWQIILDRLESMLPCGLPLRSASKEFDSRSFAHRIDCPTLIAITSSASSFKKSQAKFLEQALPNSWKLQLEENIYHKSGSISAEFSEQLVQFIQIPTRRPQKGRVWGA